jgi:hypothetical protein
MKLLLPFIFLNVCLVACFTVTAQRPGGNLRAKNKTNVAKPPATKAPAEVIEVMEPITDTFEYNIKKTIEKLSLYILDADKPVDLLMASFAGTNFQGHPEYHAVVGFPGAVDNLLTRLYVNREEKKVMWQWHAVLVNLPRAQMSKEAITDLTGRINGIVKNMHYNVNDEKNK